MQLIPRRSGESVYIGDDIRVAVVLEDGNITLAVQAPESMPVVKAEHCEGRSAAWAKGKGRLSAARQTEC